MIVCNCNGVSCRKVEEAIALGARSAKAVLHYHGHQPQCCRCLKEIAGRIKAQRGSQMPMAGAPALDQAAAE